VKSTGAKVKEELVDAREDIVDDLRTAVGNDDPARADAEPRMAVAGDGSDPVSPGRSVND
jgi:hypothetical protein